MLGNTYLEYCELEFVLTAVQGADPGTAMDAGAVQGASSIISRVPAENNNRRCTYWLTGFAFPNMSCILGNLPGDSSFCCVWAPFYFHLSSGGPQS